jgi:hypothetical protein
MVYIFRLEDFGLGELSMEREATGQNLLVKRQLPLVLKSFGHQSLLEKSKVDTKS